MKKAISIVLCIAMLFVLLPTFATAAEIVDSGTCGDGLTWTLDADGLLTISGTGEMSSSPWQDSDRLQIKTVLIESCVTNIGNYAFSNCSELTSVSIGNSVTSIGRCAFFGCWKLVSIILPNGVTNIGSSAFSDCDSLASITIPDSVTSIESSAFYLCGSLTNVYISDLAAWCRISFADYHAQPLNYAHNLYINNVLAESIMIPDGVTSIGNYAFSSCFGLTSITIPDGVSSIGKSAFEGCESLAFLTIPNSVMSIGGSAFKDCTCLSSITIPDGVTSVEKDMFLGCTSLTELTLPASVTVIRENAFKNDSTLKTIRYGGTRSQWTAINIEEGNDALTWAEILYTPHTGDHVWDEGAVLTAATCVMDGVTRYTCTLPDCGATENRTVPATGVHTFGDWTTIQQPGCCVDGKDIRVCAECAKIEVRTLPATGEHTDANADGKCDTCGATLTPGENPGGNSGNSGGSGRQSFFNSLWAFILNLINMLKSLCGR